MTNVAAGWEVVGAGDGEGWTGRDEGEAGSPSSVPTKGGRPA